VMVIWVPLASAGIGLVARDVRRDPSDVFA
jgi:hypothetical protein